MSTLPPHPLLVPFDGSFRIDAAGTEPPSKAGKSAHWKEQLELESEQLGAWQQKLYADGRFAVLLILQAMDAAGKDSTIRHVFARVNPTGLRVVSFKQPSRLELAHDFLWRTTRELPQRGEIGVFNRSYYEEVLVVRVHPELLAAQRLPELPSAELWAQRYHSIVEHERHLAGQGTVILKFWLNISKDEQRKRLLERIDEPHKRWKFRAGDLDERARWDDYRAAYGECLSATSRPCAVVRDPGRQPALRAATNRQSHQRRHRGAGCRVPATASGRARTPAGAPQQARRRLRSHRTANCVTPTAPPGP
jgi:PPK2 family polyphosphate:nucleotide phosphotransferase